MHCRLIICSVLNSTVSFRRKDIPQTEGKGKLFSKSLPNSGSYEVKEPGRGKEQASLLTASLV
ncbi:MAG: hypothetical protein D3904_05155 [Candidatus Electrothrix sp. EH2]|nr:hypothetical protein [Candidatus Electrothrix sp. EH2]